MNFGDALVALKRGEMVRRTGWNGRGMYLYLENCFTSPVRRGVLFAPVICMYTAQGRHQPGWLASQADMLSDDWESVVP